MKSTLFSKSSIKKITLSLVLMTIFLGVAGFSRAQNAFEQGGQVVAQTEPATDAKALTQISDISTFWALTKLGGGIGIAIFVVFGFGIFLIVLQVYELFMDKIRGRRLLATNFRQLSVSEFGKIVKNNPHSIIARLYSIMLSIFQTTGNTRDFHAEIANYLQLQQERFNTFKSRLSFLSDTAGALGLLGTVWGMFITFFGGNLDSQRILNGMGVALVTTLVGLVVSIILNFFTTEIFSIFNKRLELISARADEFRLWLMAIVQRRSKKASEVPPANGSAKKTDETTQAPEIDSKPKIPAFSLHAVSDFKQDGTIGHPLQNPITVVVETENGKKVSGVPVRYDVVEGEGKLPNEHKSAIIKTNQNGLAKLDWTMGGQVGPQRLRVSIPNREYEALEFVSFAQPFIPNLTDYSKPAQTKTSDHSSRGILA